MAKLNGNKVEYTNVQVAAKTTGAILAHSPYKDQNGNPINKFYNGPIQQPIPYINAFDINWCGVKMNDDSNENAINSTEDLIVKINDINNNYVSKDEITNTINQIIGNAPETLDTLQEIAAALNEKADINHNHDGVYQPIGNYADISYVQSVLNEAKSYTDNAVIGLSQSTINNGVLELGI